MAAVNNRRVKEQLDETYEAIPEPRTVRDGPNGERMLSAGILREYGQCLLAMKAHLAARRTHDTLIDQRIAALENMRETVDQLASTSRDEAVLAADRDRRARNRMYWIPVLVAIGAAVLSAIVTVGVQIWS